VTAALQLPRTSIHIATRALSRPAYVLASLIVTSTVVRTAIAWRHSTPRYFPDEYLYMELGRSIGHGHLMVRDHAARFPALLEPVLAAPLWRFFPLATAYHLVQSENALALSLAAIPVYLIARQVGLERGYSLLCSLYALVLPTTVMVVFTITDFIAYTLALAALAAALRALYEPSTRRQLAFIVFMALATLARTQYFVLAPAYVTAAVLLDGRPALRRHRMALLAFAPAVAAVGVAATGYFSVWFQNIPIGWRDLSQPALQVFLLTLASGVVLVPGAIVGLWKAPDRRTRTYALMAGTFALLMIAEVSIFSANTVRFKERYLFMLLPLIAIAFGIYRKRGLPYRWPVFLMCVAVAIAAARIPIAAYATGAGRFDSETLTALDWLQGTVGVASTSFLAAAIFTLGALWAMGSALLGRAALSLPLALALVAACTVIATKEDIQVTDTVRERNVPADPQWIDHASAGKPVTAIATPLSSTATLSLQLYWNPDVNRVVSLDDGVPPDAYATEQLKVGAQGALENVRGLFYFDNDGTDATFSNVTRVARTLAGSVYRTNGVPRFRVLIEGIHSDGWLIAGGRIRAWPAPNAPAGSRTRLSFTASVPSDWPGIAVLRIGTGKWYVHPGKPIQLSCFGGKVPLDVIYRSPSTIFDNRGRPVSVLLTHIHETDVAAGRSADDASCSRS